MASRKGGHNLGGIPLIKSKGINGSPLRGDLAMPVIATLDIAKVASEYLLNLDFRDVSVRELLGQRDISMIEMTRLIGQAIGMPDLPYVQIRYEEAEKFMIETGFSPDAARLLIELQKGINEGIVISDTPGTDENTTGTSFEEFSKTFTAIYKSG